MTLCKIAKALIAAVTFTLLGCSEQTQNITPPETKTKTHLINTDPSRLDIYTNFKLTTDLTHLSDNQKKC